MIAGSICEETDCTGVVLVLLAAFLVVAMIGAVVMVAWMVTISTVLERRGWRRAVRRTVAGASVTGATLLFGAGATVLPDAAPVGALVLALPAVPVAIWQRRVTRRAQSSPCSTA